MIHTNKTVTLRILALVFALLLTVATLPITVFAAKTTPKEQEGVRIEEAYVTNDDGVHCTTGYLVYCDEDIVPTGLEYQITNAENAEDVITDSAWVVVTALAKNEETAESDTETANTDENKQVQDLPEEPDFLVNFRMPDGEKLPAFLFASSVGESTQYALAPHYAFSFYVTTENNAGKDPVWTKAAEAADGYIFTLDRPQRMAAKLEQEEPETDENGKTNNKNKFKPSTSGSLSVYFYAPNTVRNLLSRLETDKTELLDRYGYTDLTLSVRYTLGNEKALSDEGIEKAPYLEFPLTLAEVGDVVTHTFSFEDEAFRNCFDKKTFRSYEIGGEKIEGEEETTPELTVYDIDTAATTLGVRVSFVLTATPKPDANGAVADATVTQSTLTDPFYCGKTNSMLSDPKKLDAPTAVIGTYDKDTQKLPVTVSVSDGVKDASVWLACLYGGKMREEIQISVNGEEWHEATVSAWNTSGSFMDGGTHTLDLSTETMTEYAYVRIRVKLYMDTNGENDLESAWSASASFDMRPEEVVTAPGTTEPISYYSESVIDNIEKKATCRLCGFCPSPYGICLFLWIGAVLLLIVLVVLVILMIPKRRKCPRCDTPCEPNAAVCPECGYRFVGMMPEIEDDEAEPVRPTAAPKIPVEEASEDNNAWQEAFGIKPMAPGMIKEAEKLVNADKARPKTSINAPVAPAYTPSEAPIVLPSVTPEFMAELKRKMRETKAGNPQPYTAAELAYVKALREKAAQEKRIAKEKANMEDAIKVAAEAKEAAAKEAAAERAASAARAAAEAKAIAEAAAAVEAKIAAEEKVAAEAKATQTVAPTQDKRLSAEQLARIRALRASQMRGAQTTKTAEEPLPELRRAHSAPRMVKCPHCAAPNAETNKTCNVCNRPMTK